MKKHYLFLVFFFLISIGQSSAQQLSQFVISSSGGFYSSASVLLSFTTGEMSAVETYTAPAGILTQGFQQVFDIGTYLTEHPNPQFSFGLYPNPTSTYFNLVTETETSGNLMISIVDMFGRVLLHKEIQQEYLINVEPFDLTRAAAGMYILAITFKENHATHGTQFVSKIQVIR